VIPREATASAVLYARFSPRRDPETESARHQIERCRAEARRLGLAVRGEYVDELASGADPDREGLWDSIAALRRGDTLLVESSSRLARDTVLLCTIIDRVTKLGGSVRFVDGGEVDWTDPTVKLVQTIIGAVHAFDREQRNALTRARMRLHQRGGRAMSHRPPYGYRREGNRLVPDPEEQPILDLVLGGATAAELNARGIKKRGRTWRSRDLERIINRGRLDVG